MFCHNCGSNLNDNMRFCPQCGAAQGMSVPDVSMQPAGKRKSKTVVLLVSFALLAAAALFVLLILLPGDGNDYQKIYRALEKTFQMNSAELTAVISDYGESDELSFCVNDDSSSLQYYYCTDNGRSVYGFYDGYFFRYRDYGDGDGDGRKYQMSSGYFDADDDLMPMLLFAFCGDKDVKRVIREYVTPLIPSASTRLERSCEHTDIANIRSAYASVMTAVLTQADDVSGVTRSGDRPGAYVYTATVELSQRQPGWQFEPTNTIGVIRDSNRVDDVGPGMAVVLQYDETVGEVNLSVVKSENPLPESSDDESAQNINLEKAADILLEKLNDKEWMDQSCTIEKSEKSGADFYEIKFRPHKFLANSLDEIKECFDDNSYNEMKNSLKNMSSTVFKIQIEIEDGKLKSIQSTQSGFELSFHYSGDVLSSIDYENKYDTVEIIVSEVNGLRFDKQYVEDILEKCEEK